MSLQFDKYLDEICKQLKAASPKLTVKVGEGDILLEDVQPSVTAPAAFVTFLGARPLAEASGQELAELKLAVYLFVKQASGLDKRAAATHAAAQWLWIAIQRQAWGLAGVQPAQVESLENLTNVAASKKGLMCFCLVFSQAVLLAPADPEIVGPALCKLFVGDEEI